MDLLRHDTAEPWLPEPGVLGMLHLPGLPGSPLAGAPIHEIRDRMMSDAQELAEIGVSGFVIENFGDRPFHGESAGPMTIAAMARLASEVRQAWPEHRLVVNCLRNDAEGALAVAVAAGADAIRVNVHVGAALTDQGVLTGRAADTLRRRRQWGGDGVRIFADVRVKHAAPLVERPLEVEAADLRDRGFADVLLVTGEATGAPADPETIDALRRGAPDALIFVASGVDAGNAATWAGAVDGAIIGSSFMREGRAGNGVDPDRARRVLEAWSSGRSS